MPTSCIDFLMRKRRGEPPGVCVVFGDDEFLRRQARTTVRNWVLAGEPTELTFSTYSGDQASGPAVLDEVFTPPFVGERRLVEVESADSFVSANRPQLEKLATKASPCGVLLLDVRTWSASTNLAKMVELAVDCNGPKDWHVAGWLVKWTPFKYGKQLDADVAAWLVEAAGTELGVLDQELAKLATYEGENPSITRESVDALVAGNRLDTVFKMLDAALDGDTAKALRMLDRQFQGGESAVGVLAMISAQVRKLTEAARRVVAGEPMDAALRDAGVLPFVIRKAEAQLKRMGRARMVGMYRKLLEADLDVKGGSSLSERTVVERLLVGLAR
jgi:DNA polymerase-3 subunit delta